MIIMDNLELRKIIGNCRSARINSKKAHWIGGCLLNLIPLPYLLKILDEEIGGSFEILVDDFNTL